MENIKIKGRNNCYTKDFKIVIVTEYQLGATEKLLVEKYNISRSSLYRWISLYTKNGNTISEK